MAMTLRRVRHRVTGSPLRWARVEAVGDAAVVADGVLLDLRGARAGATVAWVRDDADTNPNAREVVVNRAPDGSLLCIVADQHAGGANVPDQESTLSSYPSAIIGATGQSVASTRPGSITETEGGRAVWRRVHEQGDAWAAGVNALASRHLPSEVSKGHAWLTVGIHRAAWLVAHSSLAWAAKMAWAERVIRGAADIATPAEFYRRSEAIPGPVGIQTWVVPATAAAVNLAAAHTITPGSGGFPAAPASWSVALAEGAWVESWGA